MDDEWVLRKVRVPKGTHLSDSKATPGAGRTLLREDGSNRLMGPTESKPLDEDDLLGVYPYVPHSPSEPAEKELTPAQKELADAIAEVLTEIAREIVIPLVRDHLAPALKEKLRDISSRVRTKSVETYSRVRATQQARSIRPRIEASSTEVEASPDESRISMSLEDFREYFVRAMAAEQFATQVKRMLSNVRIKNEVLSPELERAINLALESDVTSLDEATLAVLVDFLGATQEGDGEHVLSRVRESRENRSLTQGDL